MRLGYSWNEALAGIKRAKLMSLLSVSTISAALFLLGAFLLVTINFRSAVSAFKNKFEIQAFLSEACDQHQALVAGSYIREIPGVADAVFVSKEEALRRFREELADKAELLNALETNPLPRSYRVTLRPEARDPEAMAAIAERIMKIDKVEDAEYGRGWLGKFYRIGRLLVMLDAALLLVVSLASVIVIFNTIQLTLYARRQAIEIMRLVGATDGFIRRPFLLEGMLHGFIGTLIGTLVLYLFYRLLAANFSTVMFFTAREFLVLLGFGIFLGLAGSFIAVKRFLRRLPATPAR
ncbi:MAG: permease-like cell division protein FtsX [Candidatus Edwardsbacteria bacterium]|nr:permease-like cell division protein FtsX [Candidatus Edwardsbacteria bacterium]